MARQREDLVYRPDLSARRRYDQLYALYRTLAAGNGTVAATMRELRALAARPLDQCPEPISPAAAGSEPHPEDEDEA